MSIIVDHRTVENLQPSALDISIHLMITEIYCLIESVIVAKTPKYSHFLKI